MSTSNPIPKNIKNNWSIDGNVKQGKLQQLLVFVVLCVGLHYYVQGPYLLTDVYAFAW